MRRMFAAAAVVVGLSVPLVACGGETDDGVLRQVARGTTVCIDAWDESGDEGDQAQVERKPQVEGQPDAWVVPIEVPFRYTDRKGNCAAGNFDVKVLVVPTGGFQVVDLGKTKVGEDHDNCLEGGEAYAEMKVAAGKLNWEPQDDEADDTSNDDCQRDPNAGA